MENKILETYRELSFLKFLREGLAADDDEGEGKFGFIPNSLDPDTALSQSMQSANHKNLEMPPQHPLLSKSAQFSGIDRRLTADPSSNEKAKEQYPQLRLQQQLNNQHKQRLAERLRLTR